MSASAAFTLASAFHLAGFRHVVASLWPLDAHAVRTAARSLRDTYPERPDLWAALVHSGP